MTKSISHTLSTPERQHDYDPAIPMLVRVLRVRLTAGAAADGNGTGRGVSE